MKPDLSKSKPLAIVFSSGFFGFFAHAGFLAALRQRGIVPAAYGGASSGAIVAAMAASGMPDAAIRESLFNLKKADFWDPDPWAVILGRALKLFRGYTGYLRGEGFGRLLDILPVKTFEELPLPLVIAATDLSRMREAHFTRGDLIKSIQASGAVPGLFQAVEITGSYYVDGGLTCKAPVKATADLVCPGKILVHFLGSQNLEERSNSFLRKRVTPWHIHYLAGNIARQEAYKLQSDVVRMRGIEVVEIKTAPPPLGPNNLAQGPLVYEATKDRAYELLSRYGF
jgi:NTE family protein